MPGFWFVFRFGGFLHRVESNVEIRLRRPPTILTSNYMALPLPITHSNLVRIVGRVKLVGHGVRSSAAPISGRYSLFGADATGPNGDSVAWPAAKRNARRPGSAQVQICSDLPDPPSSLQPFSISSDWCSSM
jgi:hypothetical protein